MNDAASRPVHEPTAGGTFYATVAALVAFPIVFTILGVACGVIVVIVMMVFGLEFPTTEESGGWAQDVDTTYIYLGLFLLELFTNLIVLFMAFRLFRRADKKRVIIYFGLGMLVIAVFRNLSGESTAVWGLLAVMIACLVSYMRLRQLETMRPPH